MSPDPFATPARRLRVALMLVALAALPSVASGAARVDTTGTRLLMAWNAPPGQPRSTSSIAGVCGDTTVTDTLFLCMIPGTDSPTFNGFTAEVRFRPPSGDSLAAYWTAAAANGDLAHFGVHFSPDSTAGAASPFQVQGIGFAKADRVPGGARVRMIFAVPHVRSAPVRAGTPYVLAHVLVRRPPSRSTACPQPLCVEWRSATLSWSLEYEATLETGERFAARHEPVERACAEWMHTGARTWTPPPRRTPRSDGSAR